MDQLSIRTRVKYLFQNELKAKGAEGVSHSELTTLAEGDAALKPSDPDLLAYVTRDVWQTHGSHKIKLGTRKTRAVIGARLNGVVRKFLARKATLSTWEARSQLLAEVAEPILKAKDTAEGVAAEKRKAGDAN
jgi:hypothetical protein